MLTNKLQVLAKDRLFVALDYERLEDALHLVESLANTVNSYKIGMQLFYKAGPAAIERVRAACRALNPDGCNLFLDLKLHDIPNTAAGAADSLTALGVSMLTVHAAGGLQMMRQAKQSAVETAARLGIKPPLVVAVTQLTSTDQQMMNEQIGIAGTVQDTVARYAELAQQAGLDGVVASGHEVPLIRQVCGADFLTVVPGIRPTWAGANDQKRILTPDQAIKLGANLLVIGRPITHAAVPQQAASQILAEITTALENLQMEQASTANGEAAK